MLTNLAATVVGGIGVAIGRDLSAILHAEKDSFDLGKKLVHSVRGEHRYPDQEEIHRRMRVFLPFDYI